MLSCSINLYHTNYFVNINIYSIISTHVKWKYTDNMRLWYVNMSGYVSIISCLAFFLKSIETVNKSTPITHILMTIFLYGVHTRKPESISNSGIIYILSRGNSGNIVWRSFRISFLKKSLWSHVVMKPNERKIIKKFCLFKNITI